MNDTEFKEKLCKISSTNVNQFICNRQDLTMITQEDVETLRTAALLYIAANMPSSDESDDKPCEYCDIGLSGEDTIYYLDSESNLPYYCSFECLKENLDIDEAIAKDWPEDKK